MNKPRTLALTYGTYMCSTDADWCLFTMQFFLMSIELARKNWLLLQIAFSVTILLLDFLCAILSDRYRRKYSVMASVFMTERFYLLCLQTTQYNYYCLLHKFSMQMRTFLIVNAIVGGFIIL